MPNGQRLYSPDLPLRSTFTLFERLSLGLVFLTALTISWDTVLTLEFHGTWRISQLLMLPLVLSAPFVWSRAPKTVVWGLLIALCVVNLLATALNNTHLRGWLYAGWFFYFSGFALSLSGLIMSRPHLLKPFIQTVFLAAFLNMSFGLIQFAGGLAGMDLWATQKLWTMDINRISGFTFEPSYYVTYILFYWVSALIITEKQDPNSPVLPPWLGWGCVVTGTLGMLLATSRMGWLFMLFVALPYPIRLIIHLVRRQPMGFFLKLANLCIAIALLSVSIWVASDFESFRKMFMSVGLFGNSANNADVRISAIIQAWNVFQNHMIYGAGYGEIPYEIMLERLGNVDEARVQTFLGGAPYIEIGAATGVLGLALFTGLLMILLINLLKPITSRYGCVLQALAFGFIAQFALLQLNQNIFRGYIWLSLTLLITVYLVFTNEQSRDTAT